MYGCIHSVLEPHAFWFAYTFYMWSEHVCVQNTIYMDIYMYIYIYLVSDRYCTSMYSCNVIDIVFTRVTKLDVHCFRLFTVVVFRKTNDHNKERSLTAAFTQVNKMMENREIYCTT